MTLHALAATRYRDDDWPLARSAALADASHLLARTDDNPDAIQRAQDTFHASWSYAARFTGIWHQALTLHRRTRQTEGHR